MKTLTILMTCGWLVVASSAPAAIIQVTVADNLFLPATAQIKVNDTVTWLWIGGGNHSSTSSGGLWDSGVHGTGFIFSRQFTSAGNFPYHCTVHADQVGTVVVTDPAALADGVDRPELVWTTGGNSLWVNQSRITHDRVDAGQSGRPGHRGKSWIETTVIGPATLRFWWKVSSEPMDRLRLLVDGQQRAQISGLSAWQRPSISIGAGTHVVRWVYQKNATLSGGSDRGWLDQVQLVVP